MERTGRMAFVSRVRILTLLTMAVIIGACTKEAAPPQEKLEKQEPVAQEAPRPWAVLYAFGQEGQELIDWTTISGTQTWAGRPIAQGWLVKPVVIAATGIGMTNAAAATQYVIDTYDPQGIIFTGIAGAIDPEFNVGDVVIPDRWVTHDYGLWDSKGFQTDSVFVGLTDTTGYERYLEIPVDTNLYRRLAEAADIVDFHFRRAQGMLPSYHAGGVGVSGNAFIASKSKRKQLHRDLGAVIVDMESAAVVQTAHAAGIPVAVVRGTSDLAGGGAQSAEEELRANFEAAAHNAATVVKQFLEGPATE
jgi:adenosylhomocysteine nucleosidase